MTLLPEIDIDEIEFEKAIKDKEVQCPTKKKWLKLASCPWCGVPILIDKEAWECIGSTVETLDGIKYLCGCRNYAMSIQYPCIPPNPYPYIYYQVGTGGDKVPDIPPPTYDPCKITYQEGSLYPTYTSICVDNIDPCPTGPISIPGSSAGSTIGLNEEAKKVLHDSACLDRANACFSHADGGTKP